MVGGYRRPTAAASAARDMSESERAPATCRARARKPAPAHSRIELGLQPDRLGQLSGLALAASRADSDGSRGPGLLAPRERIAATRTDYGPRQSRTAYVIKCRPVYFVNLTVETTHRIIIHESPPRGSRGRSPRLTCHGVGALRAPRPYDRRNGGGGRERTWGPAADRGPALRHG